MNNMKSKLVVLCILITLFISLVISLKFIDVQSIGPNQSYVGLARMNLFFHQLIGTHMMWYEITDWIGLLGPLVSIVFACMGLGQWVIRGKLKKVDISITLCGMFYIVLIMVYLLFEYFIINYRPILIDGYLEASFPSSHTLMIISILGSASLIIRRMKIQKIVIHILLIIFSLIIGITIVGRIVSGVHWITDIVGGVILGSILLIIFDISMNHISNKMKLQADKSI